MIDDIFDTSVAPTDDEQHPKKPKEPEKQDLEALIAKSQAEEDRQRSESTDWQDSQEAVAFEVEKIGGFTTLEDRIQTKILEEEMQRSYLSYAMAVIVSRALPDVRDGLKPVQRRILYAMHKLNLSPGAKYVKSARIVGDVIGKYHPHGDAAVYAALARLAQDFSIRYPLIDGQGNFGSIDGDAPAAMRYTEARMNKPAPYMLADIDKDTVDFVDNYDGSQREPKVLPTMFPNLLANGQTGIAVGMATEIPPHNIGEVCQAIIYLLENPEASVLDLMQFIKGPDLPTGAIIYGRQDLINAYTTGRGRVIVRSKVLLEENRIIVTEIPYQINKADMLMKIAELVKDKKIEGIRDIRDESNKEGIRIVIETKREASPEVVLNQLYKLTDLQTGLHFNMVALVQDGRQPKLLNLKEILVEFLKHRDNVVVRRTRFDLAKAEEELHILEGLKIALDHIDEVIALIRGSYDKAEASLKLQARFALSDKQAEAILQMRLQTLTNLDKSKIEQERQRKIQLIAELQQILSDPEAKKALMIKEIQEVATKLASKRRTQIVDQPVSEFNKEDYVEEREVVVQLTKEQYIKVLPLDAFRQQARGGRGVSSFSPKDEDWVKQSLVCNSHDYLLAFTNTGRVFKTRVFDLPSGSRTGRGQSLVNYLALQPGEKVTTVFTLNKEQEQKQEGAIVFATRLGMVKKTMLSEFQNIRRTGIIAIGLKEGDELIDVVLSTSPEDKIILSADNGKTVIFDRSQLSPLGRSAQGVRGMKLKKGEDLISLQISSFNFQPVDTTDSDESLLEDSKPKEKIYPSLLVITQNGFGKQTHLAEFRQTNRAAAGVKTLNLTKKTGKPVLVQILYGDEKTLIVTTKQGVTIRIDPADISQMGRNTQGVRLIKLDPHDEVVSGGVS